MINKMNLIAFLSLSLLISGCIETPDEIILPEWDVNLNIPMMDKIYTLEEIIKPQKYISSDTSEDGKQIYLLESDEFFLNKGITDFIRISSGSSLLNVQTHISNSDGQEVYLNFPEGIRVDSAEFEEGVITFSVINPFTDNVDITLTIPGITKPDGNVLTSTLNIAPLGNDSSIINLAGSTYKIPHSQLENLNNSLQMIIKVTSPSSLNSYVITNFYCNNLSFKKVTGMLPSKSLGIHRQPYCFDINKAVDSRDKTFLKEAKLNLKVDYQSLSGFPIGIEIKDLNIIARRNDGSELFLRNNNGNPNFNIKLLNGGYDGVFTEANSNVNEFVTYLPDSVIVRAEYIVNPDNVKGTFTNRDSIKFETDFSTRSYLALKRTTVEDETSIEINPDDRKKMRDGRDAEVKIEVTNAIPLNAWLKIILTDENHNPLFILTNDTQGGDTLSFTGAEIDQSGNVTSPFYNPVKTIALNSSQIEMLSRAYYALYSISFSTKDSENNYPRVVAIRPSDWIKMKAYGKVKYRVNLN